MDSDRVDYNDIEGISDEALIELLNKYELLENYIGVYRTKEEYIELMKRKNKAKRNTYTFNDSLFEI
jgi:hypothetical protein